MASSGAGWAPGVAPPWQPNTRYVAGQLVISPGVANPPDALVYAVATAVSAATWAADVTNWIGLAALSPASFVPPLGKSTSVATAAAPVPFFDVIDYGADPTGVADSTAAIQAAINAAEAFRLGAAVCLPSGSYLISATLVENIGITVFGMGRAKIVTSAHGADIFQVGDGVHDVIDPVFRDFAITSTGAQTAGWAFNCHRVARGRWHNVAFQDAADAVTGTKLFNGISLDRFDDCWISDCQIINGGGSPAPVAGVGLSCNGAADQTFGADLTVNGCKIAGWNTGVVVGGAVGGLYFDSEVIACAYDMHVTTSLAGVSNREIFLGDQAILDACDYTCLLIDADSVVHLMATGTWIASGGQQHNVDQGSGVRIAAQVDGADFQFTGCRIYNNYAAGAIIDGAVRVTFDSCSIQYNGGGATNAGMSGITVSGAAAPDLIVVGCDIHDNGNAGNGLGIYVNTNGLHLVITNNDFRGNAAGPMDIGAIQPSATSMIRDNIGMVTENTGLTQVLAATTSIVVNHGLAVTPQVVLVTPFDSDPGSRWWVSAITSTTFTINTVAAPGSDQSFGWRAAYGFGD